MKFRLVLEFDTVSKTLRVWDGAEGFDIPLPAPRRQATVHDLPIDNADYAAGILQGALGLWCCCGTSNWCDLMKRRVEHDHNCQPSIKGDQETGVAA